MAIADKKSEMDWKVLVVGNNPLELNEVFEKLKGIGQQKILTELAFDLSGTIDRLQRFRPGHILIDDNVGSANLHAMVSWLDSYRLRNVAVTVLKNSNYEATFSEGVSNFVLKRNLTSDGLYRELLTSSHFMHLQQEWKRNWGTPLR